MALWSLIVIVCVPVVLLGIVAFTTVDESTKLRRKYPQFYED